MQDSTFANLTEAKPGEFRATIQRKALLLKLDGPKLTDGRAQLFG